MVYAGGNQQYQELNPVRGYLSSQSATLHFGMGTATVADSIRILWPDQSRQLLRQVAVNQQLTVQQQATPERKKCRSPNLVETIFTQSQPALPYTHEGYNENDFKRQPLMLWMYSHTGPVLAKGDVNKDGLDDLFTSGDQQKTGAIWVQQPGGTFKKDETTNHWRRNRFGHCGGCFLRCQRRRIR